jgi:hypothetical protein
VTPFDNNLRKRIVFNATQMCASISKRWTEQKVSHYFYNHREVFFRFKDKYPDIEMLFIRNLQTDFDFLAQFRQQNIQNYISPSEDICPVKSIHATKSLDSSESEIDIFEWFRLSHQCKDMDDDRRYSAYSPPQSLTPIQLEITNLRKGGATYEELHQLYPEVRTNHSLITCFNRTAFGLSWQPGQKGGTDPILCTEDAKEFIRIIVEQAEEGNILYTIQVMALANHLIEKRAEMAMEFLDELHCNKLAWNSLELKPTFAPSWLYHFCDTHGLRIKTPEAMDSDRKTKCTKRSIEKFFTNFEALLSTDSALLFNMDETQITANKQFRVVVPEDVHPIVAEVAQFQHITAAICYNAQGYRLKPFIILNNLKKFPTKLSKFQNLAYFCSSVNGWMTSNLFYIWTIHFVDDMEAYRQTLPLHLRGKPIVLILDGHTSHGSFAALRYMATHNIIVLCLPPHCTHLCQPFDVVIGNLLKNEIRKLLHKYSSKFKEKHKNEPEIVITKSQQRFLMLRSLINAWHTILTPDSAENSFEITGLFPLDFTRLAASRFWDNTRDTKVAKTSRNNLQLGNKNLTATNTLLTLFNHNKNITISGLDLIPTNDPNDFYQNLIHSKIYSETTYPEFYELINFCKAAATNTS